MVVMLISQFIGVLNPGVGGMGFATPAITKKLQELCPQISFQGYQTLYNDTGMFGVTFTLFNNAVVPQVIGTFLDELERMANNMNEGNFSPNLNFDSNIPSRGAWTDEKGLIAQYCPTDWW